MTGSSRGQLPVVPAAGDLPERDRRVLVRQREPEGRRIDRSENGLDGGAGDGAIAGESTTPLHGRRPVVAARAPISRAFDIVVPSRAGASSAGAARHVEEVSRCSADGVRSSTVRRRFVLLAMLVLAARGCPAGVRAIDQLSAGGWLDPKSESAAVADRLEAEFGGGRTSFVALFRADEPGADATSTDFQGAIATRWRRCSTMSGSPGSPATRRPATTASSASGGDAAYVVIGLDMTEDESVAIVDDDRAAIAPPAGYTWQLTGFGPIQKDSAVQSEKDLQNAETVSLPIAALVLILVFASIVAAGMPLFVAGLAIPSCLAIINLVARQTEMSIFVLNIATMLGLALAIDYSLFIISRFREELRRGRTVGEAVERSRSARPARRSCSAASPSRSDCPGCSCSRRRPSARSASRRDRRALLGHLLADVPAGPARDARAAGQRAVARWARPPVSGSSATIRRGAGVALGASGARGHAPADRRPLAGPGRPVHRRQPGLPPGAGRARGDRDLPGRRARAATPTLPSRRSSTPARRHRSSSWPTWPGSPTDLASHPGAQRLRRLLEIDGIDRVEGPFTITDPATGALLTPTRSPSSTRCPTGHRARGPRGPARALHPGVDRSTRRDQPDLAGTPAGTDLIPIVRALEPGDGIDEAWSAAARRSRRTSWCPRANGRRGPSG